ncbi:MAG: penicillin acylase family protein [Pseudomonadota bacterium]
MARHRIAGAEAPLDIVWDDIGVAHVYAQSKADAYRGMGYAAGRERLWQIHLSCAYANGEAAALLGERFVAQDALARACNAPGARFAAELPTSAGDWIVDAYLDGLNAAVDGLDEVPPEFVHAGVVPRHFTRSDIAARYRFTNWFQHRSWSEKILLGRLMGRHGADRFRRHVLHFSAADERIVTEHAAIYAELSLTALPLAQPLMTPKAREGLAGSNNWAVTGALSASGKPLLAMDPHQAHAIPNPFFYAHLSTPDWDAFGTAFPGVPYFMMGYTRDIAWGLTTGMVDNYDVYVERMRGDEYETSDGWRPVETRIESIPVKGGGHRDVPIRATRRGPLLDDLLDALSPEAPANANAREYRLALRWSLADLPTAPGALACLPLATSAEAFGATLFEDDSCPLVNNIICVDRDNHLRRFIAASLPVRESVTGSVPLPGWEPGWEPGYDFAQTTERQLTVEVDPPQGFALTANSDTMGSRGAFPIHNFPVNPARADRIRELLDTGESFTSADFEAMQADLKDLAAIRALPDVLALLAETQDPDLQMAARLLGRWDGHATPASAAACLYYAFQDLFWPGRFMHTVLGDDALKVLPSGAPGLNLWNVARFLEPGSPWTTDRSLLVKTVCDAMRQAVTNVRRELGDDEAEWRWDALHQVAYAHALAGQPDWSHLQQGPDGVGGSANTLAMAAHAGSGPGSERRPGEPAFRVWLGPAYRLVVDLAQPEQSRFVIGGGNSARPDSQLTTNQYPSWLENRHHDLYWDRARLEVHDLWVVGSD